jgi:hypothetical protein
MTVDPLCEKYYWISPYAFCLNNPVKFIDPDGMDVKIFYQNNGKTQSFVYNGTQSNIPNNPFVKSFIGAYQYNIQNGGGDPSKNAVTNSNIMLNVTETDGQSIHSYGTIYWNPNYGSKTTEGNVLSPATVLDHEIDHGVSYGTNKKEHFDRVERKDKKYDNAEERRVITGSEQKTAKANNEIKNGTVTRTNHKGEGVITKGTTSTDIDKAKTNSFKRQEEERRLKFTSEP